MINSVGLQNHRLKGSVDKISSDTLFTDWHVGCTTVPFGLIKYKLEMHVLKFENWLSLVMSSLFYKSEWLNSAAERLCKNDQNSTPLKLENRRSLYNKALCSYIFICI